MYNNKDQYSKTDQLQNAAQKNNSSNKNNEFVKYSKEIEFYMEQLHDFIQQHQTTDDMRKLKIADERIRLFLQLITRVQEDIHNIQISKIEQQEKQQSSNSANQFKNQNTSPPFHPFQQTNPANMGDSYALIPPKATQQQPAFQAPVAQQNYPTIEKQLNKPVITETHQDQIIFQRQDQPRNEKEVYQEEYYSENQGNMQNDGGHNKQDKRFQKNRVNKKRKQYDLQEENNFLIDGNVQNKYIQENNKDYEGVQQVAQIQNNSILRANFAPIQSPLLPHQFFQVASQVSLLNQGFPQIQQQQQMNQIQITQNAQINNKYPPLPPPRESDDNSSQNYKDLNSQGIFPSSQGNIPSSTYNTFQPQGNTIKLMKRSNPNSNQNTQNFIQQNNNNQTSSQTGNLPHSMSLNQNEQISTMIQPNIQVNYQNQNIHPLQQGETHLKPQNEILQMPENQDQFHKFYQNEQKHFESIPQVFQNQTLSLTNVPEISLINQQLHYDDEIHQDQYHSHENQNLHEMSHNNNPNLMIPSSLLHHSKTQGNLVINTNTNKNNLSRSNPDQLNLNTSDNCGLRLNISSNTGISSQMGNMNLNTSSLHILNKSLVDSERNTGNNQSQNTNIETERMKNNNTCSTYLSNSTTLNNITVNSTQNNNSSSTATQSIKIDTRTYNVQFNLKKEEDSNYYEESDSNSESPFPNQDFKIKHNLQLNPGKTRAFDTRNVIKNIIGLLKKYLIQISITNHPWETAERDFREYISLYKGHDVRSSRSIIQNYPLVNSLNEIQNEMVRKDLEIRLQQYSEYPLIEQIRRINYFNSLVRRYAMKYLTVVIPQIIEKNTMFIQKDSIQRFTQLFLTFIKNPTSYVRIQS